MELLILGVLACLFGGGFALYNAYIALRTRSENAWSDIDTQLKKRFDLIPSLVATAKGYMKHEADTLEKVTSLRTSSSSLAEREKREKEITDSLNTFFILSEQYPDLKAAPQFIALQGSLVQVEEDISHARRYYNAVVRDLNTLIHTFPGVLFAAIFRWKAKPFFLMSEEERTPSSISL